MSFYWGRRRDIWVNYRTRVKLKDSISPKTHRTQRPSVRGTEHVCARCTVPAPGWPGLPAPPGWCQGERSHPGSMSMNEAQPKPLRALQGLSHPLICNLETTFQDHSLIPHSEKQVAAQVCATPPVPGGRAAQSEDHASRPSSPAPHSSPPVKLNTSRRRSRARSPPHRRGPWNTTAGKTPNCATHWVAKHPPHQ